jgi:hypothetical protein
MNFKFFKNILKLDLLVTILLKGMVSLNINLKKNYLIKEADP